MEKLVAQLNETAKVVFDQGRFDSWCVFVIENGRKHAPKDLDCFTELKSISKEYAAGKLYNDFLKFYKYSNAQINPIIIDFIKEIALGYQAKHQVVIAKWFVVIYAGMIAEENKEHTRLGKRIKHLGIYQLLQENLSPIQAANFSKGKKWQEIDAEMKRRLI